MKRGLLLSLERRLVEMKRRDIVPIIEVDMKRNVILTIEVLPETDLDFNKATDVRMIIIKEKGHPQENEEDTIKDQDHLKGLTLFSYSFFLLFFLFFYDGFLGLLVIIDRVLQGVKGETIVRKETPEDLTMIIDMYNFGHC